MRKAILLFVLLTLFGIPYLLAQGGFRITGQILSAEDNLPVIGVSVVEKGTANGKVCRNARCTFFLVYHRYKSVYFLQAAIIRRFL